MSSEKKVRSNSDPNAFFPHSVRSSIINRTKESTSVLLLFTINALALSENDIFEQYVKDEMFHLFI